MSAHLRRPNVAMAVVKRGRLLLLERVRPADSWQVPQGGIDAGEDAEEAMWRELKEETGILPDMARVWARTRDYLAYTIPSDYRKHDSYLGQKQLWFLLEFQASDRNIHFGNMRRPEFTAWRWSGYWNAIHHAIFFKRDVYRAALLELLPQALKLGV